MFEAKLSIKAENSSILPSKLPKERIKALTDALEKRNCKILDIFKEINSDNTE